MVTEISTFETAQCGLGHVMTICCSRDCLISREQHADLLIAIKVGASLLAIASLILVRATITVFVKCELR